jgi:hypothetical protein
VRKIREGAARCSGCLPVPPEARPRPAARRATEMTSDEAAAHGGTASKAKPPAFDTSVAHQARVYVYLLGGCFL